VATALLVLAGCTNAGAGGDGGGGGSVSKEDAQQGAQVAFDAFANLSEGGDCVSSEITDSTTTLTFTDCIFDGVTLNGTISVTDNDGSISTSGDLELSGGGIPVSSVTWDMNVNTTISGTITVDGTTFSYDDLGATYPT
jgi:hypothetical protein